MLLINRHRGCRLDGGVACFIRESGCARRSDGPHGSPCGRGGEICGSACNLAPARPVRSVASPFLGKDCAAPTEPPYPVGQSMPSVNLATTTFPRAQHMRRGLFNLGPVSQRSMTEGIGIFPWAIAPRRSAASRMGLPGGKWRVMVGYPCCKPRISICQTSGISRPCLDNTPEQESYSPCSSPKSSSRERRRECRW